MEKFHKAHLDNSDYMVAKARERWHEETSQVHPAGLLTRLPDTASNHLPRLSITQQNSTEPAHHEERKRSLKIEKGDGPYQMLQREHPFRTPSELAKEAHQIKNAMGHKTFRAGDELSPNGDGSVTSRHKKDPKGPDYTDTKMSAGKEVEVKNRNHHDGGFTEITDHKQAGRKTKHERHADGSFEEEERDKAGTLKRSLKHELPGKEHANHDGSPPESLRNLNKMQPNYDNIAKATVAREDDPKRRTLKETIQDKAEDNFVRLTGSMPANLTIGPAEMKARTIEKLVKDHPEQLGEISKGNPLVAALDRNNANLLAKAYFKEKADLLNCGLPGVPEGDLKNPQVRDQVNDKVRKLWASPSAKDREEALIRLYNPGAGASYVNEVRQHEGN